MSILSRPVARPLLNSGRKAWTEFTTSEGCSCWGPLALSGMLTGYEQRFRDIRTSTEIEAGARMRTWWGWLVPWIHDGVLKYRWSTWPPVMFIAELEVSSCSPVRTYNLGVMRFWTNRPMALFAVHISVRPFPGGINHHILRHPAPDTPVLCQLRTAGSNAWPSFHVHGRL